MSRGLDPNAWRAPIRVANARPGLWVALFCSVVLALSVAL